MVGYKQFFSKSHIYFSVHLQTQYKKQIGWFIILKSRQEKFCYDN